MNQAYPASLRHLLCKIINQQCLSCPRNTCDSPELCSVCIRFLRILQRISAYLITDSFLYHLLLLRQKISVFEKFLRHIQWGNQIILCLQKLIQIAILINLKTFHRHSQFRKRCLTQRFFFERIEFPCLLHICIQFQLRCQRTKIIPVLLKLPLDFLFGNRQTFQLNIQYFAVHTYF